MNHRNDPDLANRLAVGAVAASGIQALFDQGADIAPSIVDSGVDFAAEEKDHRLSV